jgi:sorbitol-6-phosphate 2-dehydrogenase
MELIIAAPFLRGLALEEAGPAGNGRAVVATAPLTDASSAVAHSGAIVVELPEGADEQALQAALRKAVSSANGALGKLFALRQAGAGILLAAAARLDDAKALLSGKLPAGTPASAPAGTAAPPAAREISADREGAAAARNLVVHGKVALVTGGAQGFGEEIVRGLAASGAMVFIADLNLAGAEKLAAALNEKIGATTAFALGIDVANEASVAEAFAAVARTTGGLDLVVSNAGVLKAGSVLEQSLSDFEFVTKVNYTAFFVVAKHAGLMMRRQHAGAPAQPADIIQINSKSGLAGSNKNGAYAGSKFGGIGLVQSFALELVEYGVKVNAICPGNFFDGPLWSDPDRGLFVQYLNTGKVPGARTIADVKGFYEAKVPMGRGCEGRDVMQAIYYLVDQRYETGQALPITGGQVMLN